ncbi:hypothetical protein TNCV_607451 [Trichonephila clavipes]|nr:hypothetical protein TNCV_607451 [Trichonephila clavipes]
MTPKWSPNWLPTWSPKMMPTWLYRQDFAKFSLNRHYNVAFIRRILGISIEPNIAALNKSRYRRSLASPAVSKSKPVLQDRGKLLLKTMD